ISSEAISHKTQGVWELRLSVSKANIFIEGLNYKLNPQTPVIPIWATSREKYFDLDQVHWLMQPRRIARNALAGAKGSFNFKLFNNSSETIKYTLKVHLPTDFLGLVKLSKNALKITEGDVANIGVSYELQ